MMIEGKRLFLLLLLTLLLAGCVSNPDLYSSAQANRARADEALRLAQLQEAALTATGQAPIIRITETAAALMVQNTQAAATSVSGMTTQTASYAQTAAWWTPTPNATSTAVFVQSQAEAAAVANQTIRDNLQLERERYTNDFWAIVPGLSYAIVGGVLVLALVWVSRRERYRPVPVDARGNPLHMMDVLDGTITDSDNNPNYRGQLSESLKGLAFELLRRKLALPQLLPGITAERQDATKQRDQLLDLATRGLPAGTQNQAAQKKLAGQEMTRLLTGPTLESRFKVLNDGSNLDVIDGEIIQVLDAEWKEGAK